MKSIYTLTGLLLACAGFTLCGWLFWPAAQWLVNLFLALREPFGRGWFVLALPIAVTASLSALTRRSKPSKRRATAKTINQTFINQITLLFNGPGQTHVLPNPDRPAAQPKTLLPDRGWPNPDR